MKLRRNVPSVDGANTAWPSTAAVAPARRASASSIESPPASAEWIRVIALCPDIGPARRIPEVHVLVEQLQQTQVLGQRGRQHEPGVGHEMVVVEDHLAPVQAVAKSHRESAFLVWVWAVSATTIFPFQKGVFADTRRPTASFNSVDQG